MKCPCCLKKVKKSLIKIVASPLGDKYTYKINNLKKYTFDIIECEICNYIGLENKIDPQESYEDYIYVSSSTKGLATEYREYVKFLNENELINDDTIALEIGSNDGLFLKELSKNVKYIIGIEPSAKAIINYSKKKLNVINDYFNQNIIDKLFENKKPTKYDLIVANYVFANLPDLEETIKAIVKLLNNKGKLIIQTGYTPNQFSNGMFDYIYHEHIHYFSTNSIKKLFEKYDLFIEEFVITSSKLHSIRYVIGRKDVGNLKIEKLINHEKFIYLELIKNLNKKIVNNLKETINTLKMFKKEKYKIFGYGASHSVTTLLHQENLGEYIDFLIDDNPLKEGLYSPGYNLEVKKLSNINFNENIVILILGWQHENKILNNLKKFNNNKRNILIVTVFPLHRLQLL